MQIDICNDTDISVITKHIGDSRITSVACSPGLTHSVMCLKRKAKAKFPILVHADWADGTKIGQDKFCGFTSDDFDADGFEICVHTETSNQAVAKASESVNEVYAFILDHINPDADIVLAFRHDFVINSHKIIGKLPQPEYIRLGIDPKPPAVAFSYRTYESIIKNVSNVIDVPIKVCGNIDSKLAVSTIASLAPDVECVLSARQFIAYTKDKK